MNHEGECVSHTRVAGVVASYAAFHFPCLSETWSNDDENVDIPNFNCIEKFKRKNVRPVGVAIYQKSNDASNIATSKMDILLRYIREIDIGQSSIGDVCAGDVCSTYITNCTMEQTS
ncbi:ATP-dependent DNA helicase [Trichonephila inaurata madagascariensis]|uniref:ATP-dependent DNA helicase n=1 Tax=Trichonephila inaurata madagascariensis TaxID=2747483 RepID=A0A8X6I5V2_9ARAC|nr:ATP-dependent DNA helicase [Trichonephila inaurata madagascariensis]